MQPLNTLTEVVSFYAKRYNKSIDDEREFAVWSMALKDYDLNDIKSGFFSYVASPSCRSFPQPGQIVVHIKENLEKKRASSYYNRPREKYEENPVLLDMYRDAVNRAAHPEKETSMDGWKTMQEISSQLATDRLSVINPMALRKPTSTFFGANV